MVFVTEKIKQANKFTLDELSSKKAIKRRPGLRTWHKVVIALVTGAVLALSGPGFDQWWLAWFMVAPFLVLLTFCHKNIDALLSGLFFGLGYHLISLHYYLALALPNSGQSVLSWQMSTLIWLAQALALSLPTMIFAWLICFLPLRPGYIPYFKRPFFSYLITVPLLWVFLHWGLAIARPLAKIWQVMPLPPIAIDPLAYSQYCVLEMLQLIKYFGPCGLEFILLLVNAVLAALFIEIIRTQERPVERVDLISPRWGAFVDLFVAFIIVGASYGLGQAQIRQYLQQADDAKFGSDANTEIGQPILPVGLVGGDWLLSDNKSPSIEQQLAVIFFPEVGKTISFDEASNSLTAMKSTAKQNKNSLFLNFVSKKAKN